MLHQKVPVFEGTIALVANEIAVLVGQRGLGRLHLDLGQVRVELLSVCQRLLPVFEGQVAGQAFVGGPVNGLEVFAQLRSGLENEFTLEKKLEGAENVCQVMLEVDQKFIGVQRKTSLSFCIRYPSKI